MKSILHTLWITPLALVLAWAVAFIWRPSFVFAPQGAAVITAPVSFPVPVPITGAGEGKNEYIEIVGSCDWGYQGTCVNLRSAPATSSPTVIPLRNNIVLKVASTTVADGTTWYKIGFDGDIHYPERITSDWWVAADFTHPFYDEGEVSTTTLHTAATTKRIVVDVSKQELTAYEGDKVFMKAPVSTGLDLTPTPDGTYKIYRKMPDSYMQGPVPGLSAQYYDLPGVPWDLYFTKDGGAIHGTYWHNQFGHKWSHGCVNLPPLEAQKLYYWADLGTPVVVKD